MTILILIFCAMKKFHLKYVIVMFIVLTLFSKPNYGQESDIYKLSLEELSNVKTSSASKIEENISDAPATIIVITQEEIRQRGYKDLSEIFEDIPGMDLARQHGDHLYKNYMRGFRNSIGDPYLMMIDGLVQNSLYYGINTTSMAAIPITHIKKVEVIYGPTSTVYGANASMGVINVITENDKKENGTYMSSDYSYGISNYHIGNMSLFYKKDKIRVSVNARFENGDLNSKIDGNDFVWTGDEIYNDARLWGDYVNNPSLLPDGFSSYVNNKGIDARVHFDNLEIGATYFVTAGGVGVTYAGDRVNSNTQWPRVSKDIFAKYNKNINKKLKVSSLLRYRFTGLENSHNSLTGSSVSNATANTLFMAGTFVYPGESVRVVKHNAQLIMNRSLLASMDLQYEISKSLAISTGFMYEHKDLQKGSGRTTTGYLFVDSIDASGSSAYVTPPATWYQLHDRIVWQNNGIYLQTKYAFNTNNILNFGVRVDNNSYYGTATTIRAGYVKHMGDFTAKLLYGQAYQEPQPRVLYGSWSGSGSSPDLKPERSNTTELNINYSVKNFSSLISTYYVQNYNTIVAFSDGATNSGERNILGLDFHLNAEVEFPLIKKLKFWTYYSSILLEEEQKFDDDGNETETGIIGDLSHHKIYIGATAVITNDFFVNLRGRYIGDKETIDTNPVDKIDGYFIVDGHIKYENIFDAGIGIGLKVTNLLDTKYFHSGIRDGNSGIESGSWTGRSWTGSKGYYNSMMPQPGRFVMLSLSLDI
jgi:outer membrane receptor for ferrienterochelin and colicins